LQFSFVLRPLAEIAPDQVHTVTGKTFHEHWQEFAVESYPLKETNVVW